MFHDFSFHKPLMSSVSFCEKATIFLVAEKIRSQKLITTNICTASDFVMTMHQTATFPHWLRSHYWPSSQVTTSTNNSWFFYSTSITFFALCIFSEFRIPDPIIVFSTYYLERTFRITDLFDFTRKIAHLLANLTLYPQESREPFVPASLTLLAVSTFKFLTAASLVS